MLISKTLSNVANNIEFGDKEGFMTIMNELIKQNYTRMQQFLHHLVSVPTVTSTPGSGEHLPIDRQQRKEAHRCIFERLVAHREPILNLLKDAPLPAFSPSGTASTDTDGSSSSSSQEIQAATQSDNTEPSLLADVLSEILEAFIEINTVEVTEEDKALKRQVQEELLEKFEEGLSLSGLIRPVQPVARPSKRLLRLLLLIERQRSKELEEELKLIKLKLHSETQMKRDLQLQILRGTIPSQANGLCLSLTHVFRHYFGSFLKKKTKHTLLKCPLRLFVVVHCSLLQAWQGQGLRKRQR